MTYDAKRHLLITMARARPSRFSAMLNPIRRDQLATFTAVSSFPRREPAPRPLPAEHCRSPPCESTC